MYCPDVPGFGLTHPVIVNGAGAEAVSGAGAGDVVWA
jgi:hypothetical protein